MALSVSFAQLQVVNIKIILHTPQEWERHWKSTGIRCREEGINMDDLKINLTPGEVFCGATEYELTDGKEADEDGAE